MPWGLVLWAELIQHRLNGAGRVPSRRTRISTLKRQIENLEQTVKDGATRSTINRNVSDTFASIFFLVDHTERARRDIARTMSRKYPAGGCAYCREKQCICGQLRPEPTLGPADDRQEGWSLLCWQTHIDSVYGHRYRSWSVEYVLQRLKDEVEEFEREITRRPSRGGHTLRSLELTDVLNRALTVASVLNVDVQNVLTERFFKCP